jgi:hypothetical protein
MPFQEPDPTDPALLVGVTLPASENAGTELAYAFAEEYAAMGFDAEWILQMFRAPLYTIAHNVHQKLGDEAIVRIVQECVNVYGRVRFVVQDAPDLNLVQIDLGD